MDRKRIGQALLFGLAGYVGVVLLALVASVPRLRHLPVGGEAVAGLGPLDLVHITKETATGGGFMLTFGFKTGLLVLLVICMSLCAAWLLTRSRVR